MLGSWVRVPAGSLKTTIIGGFFVLNMQKLSLWIMAALYFSAGINHFIHPQFYWQIMPYWIGWHREIVAVSGILEITLALLLLLKRTRRIAAWGLVILLIGVFPANIQMLLNYCQDGNPYLWATMLRLPLQFILIWWAYTFTKKESPTLHQ